MREQFAPATRPADFVVVSPEMTAVFASTANAAPVPPRSIALVIALTPEVCSLHLEPRPRPDELIAGAGPHRMIFFVQSDALYRLGGRAMTESACGFHLSSELRLIALKLRDASDANQTTVTYRLAKSLEFLCEAIRLFRAGELAPIAPIGQVSAADARRLLSARQFIHDRAEERLTLDGIARASGLSRSKLTRGFKDLFDSTVAQEIARRRLELAKTMLLTTDLSIGLVGLRAGYLNNASFSRAFGRYFGRTPSYFREGELAA